MRLNVPVAAPQAAPATPPPLLGCLQQCLAAPRGVSNTTSPLAAFGRETTPAAQAQPLARQQEGFPVVLPTEDINLEAETVSDLVQSFRPVAARIRANPNKLDQSPDRLLAELSHRCQTIANGAHLDSDAAVEISVDILKADGLLELLLDAAVACAKKPSLSARLSIINRCISNLILAVHEPSQLPRGSQPKVALLEQIHALRQVCVKIPRSAKHLTSHSVLSLQLAELDVGLICLPDQQGSSVDAALRVGAGLIKSALKFQLDPSLQQGAKDLAVMAIGSARRHLAQDVFLRMSDLRKLVISADATLQRAPDGADRVADALEAWQKAAMLLPNSAAVSEAMPAARWEIKAGLAVAIADILIGSKTRGIHQLPVPLVKRLCFGIGTPLVGLSDLLSTGDRKEDRGDPAQVAPVPPQPLPYRIISKALPAPACRLPCLSSAAGLESSCRQKILMRGFEMASPS